MLCIPLVRTAVAVLAVVLGASAAAQGATQGPDVFLARLNGRGATVTLDAPVNVTAREGYDNQPSFAPDGRSLFYTSTRDDGQADIYRYDIGARRASRVTVTAPESEYSAAMIPGTNDIGVIRVERDSTQRLWRVPLTKAGVQQGFGSVVLERVKPAGYFAFVGAQTVALFVLGRPATLQLADVATGRADTIAANIGRSLHRIPGKDAISYVSKSYDEQWWVLSLDLASRTGIPLARMPNGVEDYAWLPDGRLIAGSGSTLMVCDPSTDAAWKQVADLAQAGVTGITRLAVSPDGRWIAIVGVPK
jgi:dipeptidyl aminopeptidase/acylaminoacyl peptidase